jgi:hypothetical protein
MKARRAAWSCSSNWSPRSLSTVPLPFVGVCANRRSYALEPHARPLYMGEGVRTTDTFVHPAVLIREFVDASGVRLLVA